MPRYWDIRDLVYKIEELRKEGKFTHLYLAFNRYISVSQHRAEVVPVLPLPLEERYEKEAQEKYLFLSDTKLLAERLSFEYLFASVYRAIVESFISEQATRLTIMDAATNHAQDMIESLTTWYHKMRQEQITQELKRGKKQWLSSSGKQTAEVNKKHGSLTTQESKRPKKQK